MYSHTFLRGLVRALRKPRITQRRHCADTVLRLFCARPCFLLLPIRPRPCRVAHCLSMVQPTHPENSSSIFPCLACVKVTKSQTTKPKTTLFECMSLSPMTFPYLWCCVFSFHVRTALSVLNFQHFGPRCKYTLQLFSAAAFSSNTDPGGSRCI